MSTPEDFISEAAESARRMLQSGAPRTDILARLVAAGERLAGPGTAVSILVIDEQGLLRNGASPGLPVDYLRAIDKLKPHAFLGTCAAAAATGKMVVTPSFLADDKWAELRHLPMSIGYEGAWSMPIKAPDGIVLGTFGTYFRKSRSPSEHEVQSVAMLAAAAALVLGAPESRA